MSLPSTNPLPSESQGETPLNTSSVSFPSTPEDRSQDDVSLSSKLTSSDKLSALPSQSSPTLNRVRNAARSVRHSLDAATSPPLPSVESSPPMTHAQRLLSTASGGSDSDTSLGRETPKQRVSFESDRASLPANLQSIRQVIANRGGTRSDSVLAHTSAGVLGGSPKHQARPSAGPVQSEGHQTPPPRSPAHSRAASPFHRFLHRAHSRDEPFIPVDPFKLRTQWFTSPTSTPQRQSLELKLDCEDTLATCIPQPITCGIPKRQLRNCGRVLRHFFIDTLPRQAYLHILLKLPALYFSRVARIFEDAEVSKHEIQRMIDICALEPESDDIFNNMAVPPSSSGQTIGLAQRRGEPILPYPEEWVPPTVTPALSRFKGSWEQFVDSLLREWKTLNLVSALLCTAILTMFQVPDAAGDPLTRWAAIFSLIFALMSLIYGCIYIVQFGTMRSMYKASRWAEEARRTRTLLWWNVWVLLATPAIWLAWSMIAFIVAIISFVWRTGATTDPPDGIRPPLTHNQALAVRVVVTCILFIGVVHLVMIIQTFQSYSGMTHRRRKYSGHEAGNGDTANLAERGAGGQVDPKKQQEERGREKGSPKMDAVPGLGLTGLSNSLNTFGSASAVLIEDSDPEKKAGGSIKREEGSREGGFGGSRPKISPKL